MCGESNKKTPESLRLRGFSLVDDTGLELVSPTHCKRSLRLTALELVLNKKPGSFASRFSWWTIQDSNL